MSDNGVQAIGVGLVGARLDQEPPSGILARMPQGPMFRLVAFSDEGLEPARPERRPVRYYADYNMLLRDPAVELVLVDGPLQARRDFAVRALNAGRHVVLRPPFCESAPDAERVMKTALRNGLLATMEMPWRDDPDLAAVADIESSDAVVEAHVEIAVVRPRRAGAGHCGRAPGAVLVTQIAVPI